MKRAARPGIAETIIAFVIGAGGLLLIVSLLAVTLMGLQGMGGNETLAELVKFFAPIYGISFAIIGIAVGTIVLLLRETVQRSNSMFLGFTCFVVGGIVNAFIAALMFRALDKYETFFRSLTDSGPLGGFMLAFLLLSLGVAIAIGGVSFW